MDIISAKKTALSYVVETKNGTFFVPDDMENPERKKLDEWLKQGGVLEDDNPSGLLPLSNKYNWNGLAIRFEISQLNQILTRLKDESTNPLVSPIWRISDDLAKVITLSIFSDEDRIERMNLELVNLFEKLKEGKVPISQEIKDELVDALVANGFNETAEIVKGIKI